MHSSDFDADKLGARGWREVCSTQEDMTTYRISFSLFM